MRFSLTILFVEYAETLLHADE